MKKYDFSLDLNSVNSNSVILNNIKPNSEIFEFGCAHGRMTKYLKQNLNCYVDICEIDEEAGQEAAKFARDYYTGTTYGDLTRWDFRWNRPYYNYVIFADVLEHLSDPKKYLEKSKGLLRQNGSIWISIPNISHNSVLIDLLNDKFEYKETGLLDFTHLKFFTESSLDDLVKSCGLVVAKKHNLINVVENTEFKNSYSDVPENISQFLKTRKNGEVYQFVWELKCE